MAGAVTTFLDEELLWKKAKSGGSPILTLGAIRPDAEVFKEWKRDSLLVHDDGITIPAYSETLAVLEETGVYLTEQVSIPSVGEEYDYLITFQGLTYPIYNTDEFAKGREEYYVRSTVSEFQGPHDVLSLDADPSKTYRAMTLSSAGTISYGALFCVGAYSGKMNSVFSTQGVGHIQQVSPHTQLSIDKVTIVSPRISILGSSSYFSQHFWEAMTDIRVQHILQIWRAPRNNLNLNGWSSLQLINNIIDCATSPTHKLV